MKPMTEFERMVDRYGHELEWRGRWVYVVPRYGFPPELPATFPRSYYKETLLP